MTRTDGIRENLKAVARSGMVANAYLITGGTAALRKELAEEFANLLVTSPADLIRPEETKSGLFSVDDVRRGIADTVSIRPYGEGKKVYLVEKADEMNVQAESALLKTLEEPPAYVVILLLAAGEESFLPTVLSRSVKIHLAEQDGEVADEESAAIVEKIRAIFDRGRDIPEEEIIALFRGFPKNRALSGLITDFLLGVCRDALVLKNGGSVNLLNSGVRPDAMREISERLRPEKIRLIIEKIEEAAVRTEENVSFELLYEALLLGIARALKEDS